MEQQSVTGMGETVLLVDDEEVILESVAEVLRSLDYRVVEACNGAIALDCFRDHGGEISLVLSDVVMPELGGIELVQQIRDMGSEVPVILMSGYDFSERSEEIEGFVNCEQVNKPVSIVELSQLIQTMLKADKFG